MGVTLGKNARSAVLILDQHHLSFRSSHAPDRDNCRPFDESINHVSPILQHFAALRAIFRFVVHRPDAPLFVSQTVPGRYRQKYRQFLRVPPIDFDSAKKKTPSICQGFRGVCNGDR
jgi:hypothetical protein